MSAALNPKRRLGRGLSSLIEESSDVATSPDSPNSQAPTAQVDPGGTPREIAIGEIAPNPYQPRRTFDETELAELAQSISLQGILQPLIVTNGENVMGVDNIKNPFALIAGERRLRAAKLAGLATVPCVIRDANQQQMIEWAVIENIQRADLNPIERGQAYRDYMDKFSVMDI